MSPGIPVKRWTALAASLVKTSPENYTVQLFIDGSKVAEKSFHGKVAKPNGNPVSIGKCWGGPWFFYGLLGKVLVFEPALDEKQISELAKKEPPNMHREIPGMIKWLRLACYVGVVCFFAYDMMHSFA